MTTFVSPAFICAGVVMSFLVGTFLALQWKMNANRALFAALPKNDRRFFQQYQSLTLAQSLFWPSIALIVTLTLLLSTIFLVMKKFVTVFSATYYGIFFSIMGTLWFLGLYINYLVRQYYYYHTRSRITVLLDQQLYQSTEQSVIETNNQAKRIFEKNMWVLQGGVALVVISTMIFTRTGASYHVMIIEGIIGIIILGLFDLYRSS